MNKYNYRMQHIRGLIILFVLLVGLICSCKPNQKKKTVTTEKSDWRSKTKKQGEEPLGEYIPKIDSIIIRNEIARMLSDSVLEEEFNVSEALWLDSLYDNLNHHRVWDMEVLPLAFVQLKECKFDGLYSKDYDVEVLESLFMAPAETDSGLSVQKARLDVLMTNAYLKYGKHLTEGKTNPYHLDPNWNYKRRTFTYQEVTQLIQAAQKNNPNEYISYCRPGGWYYASLMKWMKRSYDTGYAFLDTLNLSYPGKSIRKGDSGEIITRLKYRLKDFQSYAGTRPDNVFDDSLEIALKEFQKYRGLVSDGVAGKSTFEALKMTVAQQRDQIRVNMERARWLVHDLPKEFLLVNIAAYQLYIFRNSQVDYQSNVVVGKFHHKTPIFYSTIKYIQFNCTWTVPRKIAVEEILPLIQQDKSYLQTRHFDVLNQQGEIVNYWDIDFLQLNKNNFPYTLRQQPGPYNSLGSMKFIFPNKYSVYLHDTPARYLFEKEGGRAFSHGCVRVQHPERLAAELLKKNGITLADIHKIVEKKATKDISLKTPMPIFITYWTCYEGKTGKHLYFLQDIYERDAKVLAALQK